MTTQFEHVYATKPNGTTHMYSGYSHLPQELAHKVFRMGVGVQFPDFRRKWAGEARLSEDLAWYIDAEGARVCQAVVTPYMGQWSMRSLDRRQPMRMWLKNILHPEIYQRQRDHIDRLHERHWAEKIRPIITELREKFPAGVCDSRGRHFRASDDGWSLGSRCPEDPTDPMGDRCFQVWNKSSNLITARDEATYRLYLALRAHLPAQDEDLHMLEAVVKVHGLDGAVHVWKLTRQHDRQADRLTAWAMEPWTERIDLEFPAKEV